MPRAGVLIETMGGVVAMTYADLLATSLETVCKAHAANLADPWRAWGIAYEAACDLIPDDMEAVFKIAMSEPDMWIKRIPYQLEDGALTLAEVMIEALYHKLQDDILERICPAALTLW